MKDFTDYNYTVQVRIDSDSGAVAAFVFGQDSGPIGRTITAGDDIEIARLIGTTIMGDARLEEHGAI